MNLRDTLQQHRLAVFLLILGAVWALIGLAMVPRTFRPAGWQTASGTVVDTARVGNEDRDVVEYSVGPQAYRCTTRAGQSPSHVGSQRQVWFDAADPGRARCESDFTRHFLPLFALGVGALWLAISGVLLRRGLPRPGAVPPRRWQPPSQLSEADERTDPTPAGSLPTEASDELTGATTWLIVGGVFAFVGAVFAIVAVICLIAQSWIGGVILGIMALVFLPVGTAFLVGGLRTRAHALAALRRAG